MNSTFLFYTIIGILLAEYLMETLLDYLNTKQFLKKIPEELHDVYNDQDYQKARAYHLDNYRFGLLKDGISLVFIIGFLFMGGFDFVDGVVRDNTDNTILQALGFFGILSFVSSLISLPFSYYQTFIIEEKYGFNKSTRKTFIIDIIKSSLLSLVLGGGILGLVIWFLDATGSFFWLYAWGTVIVLMILMNLFYSKLVVPLFNKQTPLEPGSLKNAIENYSKKVGFDLKNIFVIDGSKRSTKANAYFSGFGSVDRPRRTSMKCDRSQRKLVEE